MNRAFYLKLYLATIPIFISIDAIWLAFIAKDFYKKHIGHLMSDSVFWTPAIIFYALFIAGIIYFAVLPALREKRWQTALLSGLFLGVLTYATYDLTNWATLQDWPAIVVYADILWGGILCGTVALTSYFVGDRLLS